MARTNFERLRVYQLSEKLADQVWEIVLGWNFFAHHSREATRECRGQRGSEPIGRSRTGAFLDNKRFVRIARGSLNETQHLRRAYKRSLLTKQQVDCLKPLIEELAPTLNAYLKSIGDVSEKRPSIRGN